MNGGVDPGRLPRLVYFADVPVENYMHGSALMYRLLETYPKDRLLIVESVAKAAPERRLPGVEYRATRHPFQRLLRTRLGPKLSGLYAFLGGDGADALEKAIGDFAPQAVLTVVHGHQWQGAAAYARDRGIPLHVIAHDRWQDTFTGSQAIKTGIARRFAAAYRQAASRFCVSPHMVDVYEDETGARGDVLYPARRRDFKGPSTVSPRVAKPGTPFTVAYAGSIPEEGLINALSLLARVLKAQAGQLLVFGPYTTESLAERGLAGDNVIAGGSVPPTELATRLRSEADLLAASVSFSSEIRSAMELCFPSKLTDYSATGTPILVHGPPTSSAVRWGRDNPGVAEIVDTLDEVELARVLARLMSDMARRQTLAETALKIGDLQFAGDRAEQRLFGAIARD